MSTLTTTVDKWHDYTMGKPWKQPWKNGKGKYDYGKDKGGKDKGGKDQQLWKGYDKGGKGKYGKPWNKGKGGTGKRWLLQLQLHLRKTGRLPLWERKRQRQRRKPQGPPLPSNYNNDWKGKKGGKGKGGKTSDIVCYYCGKPGHTSDK
eukprot:4841870-Amphidinium_carterae.1